MRTLARRLLDLALPERCPACNGPTAGGFCAGCAAELPRIGHACGVCGLPSPVRRCPRERGDWHVLAVRAPFRYAPPLDAYLVRLKFGNGRALGRALALAAAPSLAEAGTAEPLLVPVPLSRERLVERGYNQATEIARALARELGLTLAVSVAARRAPAAPQSRLGARARRANVAGSFVVARPLAVRGRPVVIVDDVITTGATVNALAAALLAAGAERLEAWAVARTIGT